MKLISIKKIEDKTYRIDGNSYFISGLFVFLFLFVIGSLLSWSFYNGLTIALLAICFSIPVVMINDLIGKKKHKSIHNSNLFKELYKDGFEREEIGEYIGVIKLENLRTVRCYYDWSKYAKGFLSFGDIVINIFYKPLIKDYKDFELNETRIKELNKNHERKGKYGSKRFFMADRIVLHLNYYPWTKPQVIKKKITDLLEILETEGLKPFDTKDITDELKEYQKIGTFLPNMELIWNELDKNDNKI